MNARGVIVRRASAADLDTVVALRLALLREYGDHPIYGQLRPDAESRARPIFAAQLVAEQEAMFLAEIDGQVVGIVRCVDSAASPLLVPERYCYVSSAYVRPERRHQGVLRTLLARAREWCADRGLTQMRLHNVGDRDVTAVWDAMGFQVVEQVRVLRMRDAEPADAADRAAQRRRSEREQPSPAP